MTIPIDSLAGLSDTPGTLSGYGVLPADLVRRLAAGDTRWRHILTDRATGAVLDVGTWSYRPPTALDRHVRTRDVTCRFPGCTVPARECDLDHLIPFPQGPTNAGEPALTVPTTPPAQARRQLDSRTPPQLRTALDQPPGHHPRHLARHPPRTQKHTTAA